jgi:hypothetical protein
VSVSKDMVKVWSLNEESCVNELNCSGRQFSSCAFHPTYPSLLVIGCYQVSIFMFYGLSHDCMDLGCLWLDT